MNQNIKQILFPYDGTSNSEIALKHTLKLAQLHQAKVLTLTCIKDQATFGFFKLKSDKKSMERQKQKAIKKIENIKKQAEKLGVSIKSKIVRCDIVSREIVDYAKKEKVDIIAMSKTRHGTIAEKMYSESTVDKVFKESPCTFMHIK